MTLAIAKLAIAYNHTIPMQLNIINRIYKLSKLITSTINIWHYICLIILMNNIYIYINFNHDHI